jgi:hypothetical protein
VFLSCPLQTHRPTPTNTHTQTRRINYEYYDRIFRLPAPRSVLRCYNCQMCSTLPKQSVLYCTPPKFSRVTLPEQFCIPLMLQRDQARRVSESESGTVPYKQLIRQKFGSHITRTITCQAKILIDSSTFYLYWGKRFCNSSNLEARLTLT